MSDEKGDYLPPEGAEVGFNFKTPYVVPNGNNIGFNFKYLWYHPPKGNNIGFNFTEAYTPPIGNSIGFNFSNSDDEPVKGDDQYIFPESFFTQQIGTLELKLYTRYVLPFGFTQASVSAPSIKNTSVFIRPAGQSFSLFGNSKIENKHRFVQTNGLSGTLFGQPLLFNNNRYVRPNGSLHTLFGTPGVRSSKAFLTLSGAVFSLYGQPRISYRVQSAQTKQANPFSLYGQPFVSHGVRRIEQQSISALFTRYGTAWASHSPRYIEPRGIFELFSSNHVVGTSRSIFVASFIATKFGTRIIPENRTIYPQGFSNEMGHAEIYNLKQQIRPRGFLTYGAELHHRFGYNQVWNLRQIIQPNNEQHEFGPKFGRESFTKIENRNRRVQVYGFLETKFGYQRLDSNARVISPQGIASPIEVERSRTMVAYRIRSFKFPSIEPPHITTRHIVRLGAQRFDFKSPTALSLFGQASLKNTRRYYKYIGLGEQQLFGRPMISYGVRTLSFEFDYTIHPPRIPMPTVKHGQRYIEVQGLDSVRYGWMNIASRFNKATPRWNFVERVGEPIIKNVTPELRTRGFVGEGFGRAYVGHYTRYLRLNGLNSQIFGRARIADSTQHINLTGFGIKSEQINRLHEVKKLQADPVRPQTIYPYGFEVQNFKYSRHTVSSNVIRHTSSQSMTLFGVAKVTANTIRVEPGYWEILMGRPTIEHSIRTIAPKSIGDLMQVGRPQMSPHTIYAVMDAPDQAKRNHDVSGNLHYVNTQVEGRNLKVGVVFGFPMVSHKQQFIQQYGYQFTFMGLPEIINAQEIIKPKGMNTLRMGVISPLGTQNIKFRLQSIYTMFGTPGIAIVKPYDPYIKAKGFAHTSFGETRIENLHREVKLQGFLSQAMGTLLSNDKPYMWQGLRVGAHVPNVFGGNVHTRFGLAWISDRVREIKPQGEDFSLVNEYDPYDFKLRTFVWNRNKPEIGPRQTIKPTGFLAQAFSTPNIKPAVHYIRPDGNTDHYRKGGSNA